MATSLSAEGKSLEEWADVLCEVHIEWFREHPGDQLIMACAIVAGDGKVHMAVLGWADAAERRWKLKQVTKLMRRLRATRYAIWAETWMSLSKTDPGTYVYGTASKDPKREEAVLTYVTDGVARAGRVQRIVRAPDGTVAALERASEYDDDIQAMGGALTELMPRRADGRVLH